MVQIRQVVRHDVLELDKRRKDAEARYVCGER